MKMQVVIADDEPLARERLRGLLEAEPDCELAAECANGVEVVEVVRKHAPHLLFLDIQMPGMGGFEALKALGQANLPLVIFVTAYDRHAIKAFEVHALDYLLKPFKPSRFKEAVQRARETLATREAGAMSRNLVALLRETAPAPAERLSRISVKTGDRVVFVKASQIDYIEAAGNYVVIHVGKENHVLRETLTALEDKLDPKQFLRVSRSALVNIDQIKEIQPLFKGEHALVLHNGKQLPMTRGLREVQEALKFS